ncbi:MAG TPA: cupin domain-containing protein [Gemmataceae bacterium]|jgi:cupin 2 domain-containing protein|nr:cupin domain-containing protein [Gemmataceae bacterium]
MPTPSNLFANILSAVPEEQIQSLLATETVRIERIVSMGHASPPGFWYDQDTHEWVLLLQGSARLRFEGEVEIVELTAGCYCNIPAHHRHRVESTDPAGPTIWLAVHYR